MSRTRLAIFMRRALDHSSIFLFTLYPLRSRTYLEFKEDIIEDYSKDCRDSFNSRIQLFLFLSIESNRI